MELPNAMSVSIAVNDEDLQGLFSALGERCLHPRPALEGIGEALVTSVKDNFKARSAPDGAPWKSLSPRYARWKTKEKGRNADDILMLTRRLYNSIDKRVSDSEVAVGTIKSGSNVVYAAIHQLGGIIRRGARRQTLYFKMTGKGTVGRLFVKKGKSDFAQDVDVKAHDVTMPARPFLGVKEDDWEEFRNMLILYITLGKAQ